MRCTKREILDLSHACSQQGHFIDLEHEKIDESVCLALRPIGWLKMKKIREKFLEIGLNAEVLVTLCRLR